MSNPGLFPDDEPPRVATSRAPRKTTAKRKPAAKPKPAKEPGPALVEGLYCQVAVNRPMRCEFTYTVPESLAAQLAPGVRVAVSFARRREVAVVVGLSNECDLKPEKLKPLADVLDPEPIVDTDLLELTQWMASYYACSWGEALAAVLPAALKREKGRRLVAMLRPAKGVGETELAGLEESRPKQHRLLRTLMAAGGPLQRNEILRRTNLSYSPLNSLLSAGLVELLHVDPAPDELLAVQDSDRRRPDQLTEHQSRALERITAPLEAHEFAAILLRGVTGSGKTEVYLRVIEAALASGRGAIVLVPEIALTPQTVGWFRSRFESVAVLHSRMTDGQRLAMWRSVQRGESRVVVGARSAVFAPVRDLGVIVVDEEHEPSFKQGNVPRYHARDVAVMRARMAQAVCILGSATPSLESWVNAKRERYQLVELPERVHGAAMPKVQVVDMRQEMAETKAPALFSRLLQTRLEETLKRGEQAILFLNRRGFAPVLWCRACGETVKCTDCDNSMTLHKRVGRLVCHTCCAEIVPPAACPACTAPGLRFLGTGSERVEDAVSALLPTARVRRMDSDTMLRREDYEECLSAFGRGDLDILVGTQMIAKGLDFPRVTLVGIVSADSSLHLPDFRAAERTFQLISQVAGRAGRGELPGHIVIQTVTPDHPAVVQAARHGFETFAGLECELRKELGYPPFGRLIRVVFEDEDEQRTREAAERFGAVLAEHLTAEGVTVLGPVAAPMAMVRGRHRMHLLLKAPGEGPGMALARSILVRLAGETHRPRVSVDVDPLAMM